MNTIMFEGVEYTVKQALTYNDDSVTLTLVPIAKPQKTLVQLAAETCQMSEDKYRNTCDASTAVYDEIERRLQALEEKVK